MRIIFKNIDNTIGVMIPTEKALSFATIEQIAEKDVPAPYEAVISRDSEGVPLSHETYNTPYWIRPVADIPTDRTYRDAWGIDPIWGDPDGFGGTNNEFDDGLLEVYNANK